LSPVSGESPNWLGLGASWAAPVWLFCATIAGLGFVVLRVLLD
jgi:hypothetical protein